MAKNEFTPNKEYSVRLTKKSFYGGGLSSLQGTLKANSDDAARREAWDLGLRTEIRLSGSLIEKIEVQINGQWEEVTRDSVSSENKVGEPKTKVCTRLH